MDVAKKVERMLLRLHPDPQVREAARERARRARERARHPELMRMLAEELKQQATLAARLAAEDEGLRLGALRASPADPGRAELVEAERVRAPEALPGSTWAALEVSAASRTEQQLLRHRAAVLARVGVRPETVDAPTVSGAVVAAAVREVEEGHTTVGLRCAGVSQLPFATTVIITATALDAVAVAQLRAGPDTAAIAIGSTPDPATLRELRTVLAEAQTRLQAVHADEHVTVALAFGRREAALVDAVRRVIPPGLGVEQHLAPDAESWAARLAKVEQEMIRRNRVKTAARVSGPAL